MIGKWKLSQIYKTGTILLMIVTLLSCIQGKVLEINDVKVYASLGGTGRAVADSLRKAQIGRIVLVNGNYIHSKDGLYLEANKLTERIIALIPDPKGKDIVVLDWEGKRMKQLLNGAVTKGADYRKAKEQLLSAYRLVKRIRPQTTVGFYGFPERNYWKRDASWRERNIGIKDLLKEVDAIFPSIYDFYQINDRNRDTELAYARENTEEAISLGAALGKPVYPFVWHRYHDSNKKVGKQLIPTAEFEEHLRTIATTKVGGKKIDGLIWWSSERYFFNISDAVDKSADSFDRINSPETLNYFNTLKKALYDR